MVGNGNFAVAELSYDTKGLEEAVRDNVIPPSSDAEP